MNKLALLIFVLTQAGCSNYSTNVISLMADKKFEKYEVLKVRGYIHIEYDDMNLYHEKNADEHIDVAFDKNMTFDKPLREGKYTCVDVTGRFRQYSEGYIYVGNANSKHGIIVATDIRRCK
ncbi:MAG: hypothetical protein DWP95_08460 [Proteobacteria bacterium]|nr:MAG: hypothetical protein DWP95_08460 [Pseudomonadota bacterium]